MTPRDIPITREQVYKWIDEYNAAVKKNKRTVKLARETVKNKGTIEDYVKAKVDELDLEDPFVNTAGNDSLSEVTPLHDVICMDLSSYPNYVAPGS